MIFLGKLTATLDEARATAPAPTRPRADSTTLRCGEALQRGDYASVLGTMTNDFQQEGNTAWRRQADSRAQTRVRVSLLP